MVGWNVAHPTLFSSIFMDAIFFVNDIAGIDGLVLFMIIFNCFTIFP